MSLTVSTAVNICIRSKDRSVKVSVYRNLIRIRDIIKYPCRIGMVVCLYRTCIAYFISVDIGLCSSCCTEVYRAVVGNINDNVRIIGNNDIYLAYIFKPAAFRNIEIYNIQILRTGIFKADLGSAFRHINVRRNLSCQSLASFPQLNKLRLYIEHRANIEMILIARILCVNVKAVAYIEYLELIAFIIA